MSAAITSATLKKTAFSVVPFRPRRWLSNGHLQTIVGNSLPRQDALPAGKRLMIEVVPPSAKDPASKVLCVCHWQPAPVRAERLTVILLHGLEGSSDSQYMVGNANKMWRAGMNVVRMNMRNCGGTEADSPTLYHSGLSGDVEAVRSFLTRSLGLLQTALVGYSMGGNLVLKLAGELGAQGDAGNLCAVVGVSPAVDLGASADALHEPLNRFYERRFLKNLIKRFLRKAKLRPGHYDIARVQGLKSLRDFDDRVTAFYGGFAGAADYYHRAAAARVLGQIRVPTLILHALDDPFVRLTEPTRAAIRGNPSITMIETKHGGHCAFLGRPDPVRGDDGYWAESTLLRFLEANGGRPASSLR
jgi:predicted alpha/beta-fold hydrolase